MSRRAKGEGSIYRQGTAWIAQLVRDGKKVRRTRKTKAEAAKALEELKAQGARGLTAYKALTVAGWVEVYINTYCTGLRANTRKSYRQCAEHITGLLGEVRLQDLTAVDVQGAVNALDDRPRTARYMLTLLRAALRRAAAAGIIAANPAKAIKAPPARPKVHSLPTTDEILAIAAYHKNNWWYALVILAATTGARLSELLALQTEDVIGNVVYIRHALILGENAEKGAPRPLIRERTKTAAGERAIIVPASVIKMVLEARRKALAERLAAGAPLATPYLFSKADGSPLNPGTVSALFSHTAKALGIKSTFHDLRHAMASRLYNEGIAPKEIQEQLGHSSVRVTLDIYTHLEEEAKRGTAEAIERAYKGLIGGTS